MTKIISIYKTFDHAEADILKSKLENAGIACFIKSDEAGGTLSAYSFNGMFLMIREEDALQAQEIINENLVDEISDDPEDEIDPPVYGDRVAFICCLLIFLVIPVAYLLIGLFW